MTTPQGPSATGATGEARRDASQLGELYDPVFFRRQQKGARRSAEVVVPLVMDVLAPKSVVDVGCGTGAWLSVFKQQGLHEVLGIDGDYVPREQLEISTSEFEPFDLANPFSLPRTFDLVVSLEVAEHLPNAQAEHFVSSLTGLGPAILFSAAIPFQGGEHHVNEQWPDFWATLFKARDYLVFDMLRDLVWCDDRVEWWYAQNMLLFVRHDCAAAYPRLAGCHPVGDLQQLRRVHPKKFLEAVDWQEHLYRALGELEARIPPGGAVILADGGCFWPIGLALRRTTRFPPDHGGHALTDEGAAIADIERLREGGEAFFALTREVFWWLDYYRQFAAHLDSNYARLSESEDVILYDLRQEATTPSETGECA